MSLHPFQPFQAFNAFSGGVASTIYATIPLATPTRSDLGWALGFNFTVGAANITVTDLGRTWFTGNLGTRKVKIVQMDGTELASVILDTSSGVNGEIAFAPITPIVLASGSTYACLVEEVSDPAQPWYNEAPITGTSAASIGLAAFQLGITGAVLLAAPNTVYGAPNFKYQS